MVELDLPPPEAHVGPEAEPSVDVDVVHVDDDVVVVDKPAGLVVHPGAGNRSGTLVSGLLARFPEIAAVGDPDRPGIVHRLDRGTSGLLAVARSEAGYDGLVAQLAAPHGRAGLPRARAGAARTRRRRGGCADRPVATGAHPHDGAPATAVRPAPRTRSSGRSPNGVALLRCRLETGRTHQIRVHLVAIGHPVVGDDVYGDGRHPPEPLGSLDRIFLHATRLGFDHPVTGEHLAFDSPLPARARGGARRRSGMRRRTRGRSDEPAHVGLATSDPEGAPMRRRGRRETTELRRIAPLFIVLSLIAAACGSGGAWAVSRPSTGTPTTSPEAPTSTPRRPAPRRRTAATRSSSSALPNDADQQREQLVRRLAAKDSDIDLISMDVIWTAEFAEAGWISRGRRPRRKQVTEGG